MTTSRLALWCWGAIAAALPLSGARAAAHPVEPRFGAVVGMGFAATRIPGAFRWNLSAPGDSALAVVRAGASAGRLHGFVSMAAVRGVGRDADTPEFAWREGALWTSWRAAADSAALVVFAHQPDRTWLDLPLVQWTAAPRLGGNDASGARLDAAWRRLAANVMWIGGLEPTDRDAPAAAAPAAFVYRVQARARGARPARAGFTWARDLPPRGSSAEDDAAWRDVLGFDASAQAHGVWAAVQYAETHASSTAPDRGGGSSSASGTITGRLPAEGALWAELRAPALELGPRFRFGCAPAYRAIGAGFVDRLQEAEPATFAPRRGVEGPRIEAWLTAHSWPAWARQVFQRDDEFGDAAGRSITQTSEVQAWLTTRMRARVWYVQRSRRDDVHPSRSYHDDLVGEIVAEDRAGRVRLQSGWVDLHSPAERGVVALESTAPVAGRLHLLARLAAASTGPVARRSAYVGLQYWHLPEFEMVLEYGTAQVADGSEPALDTDLTAAGAQEDRIRLHFRGWF